MIQIEEGFFIAKCVFLDRMRTAGYSTSEVRRLMDGAFDYEDFQEKFNNLPVQNDLRGKLTAICCYSIKYGRETAELFDLIFQAMASQSEASECVH